MWDNFMFEGMVDYCDGEEFYASCPSGTTVLVTSAHYGRMNLGRCVQVDLGYLGCQVDVTEILNSRCSGEQSCAIRIPDEELDATNPCYSELAIYLAVSYTCEPLVEMHSVTTDLDTNMHEVVSSGNRNGNYITLFSLGGVCLLVHWATHLITRNLM